MTEGFWPGTTVLWSVVKTTEAIESLSGGRPWRGSFWEDPEEDKTRMPVKKTTQNFLNSKDDFMNLPPVGFNKGLTRLNESIYALSEHIKERLLFETSPEKQILIHVT
jgi:hypothetical protein